MVSLVGMERQNQSFYAGLASCTALHRTNLHGIAQQFLCKHPRIPLIQALGGTLYAQEEPDRAPEALREPSYRQNTEAPSARTG